MRQLFDHFETSDTTTKEVSAAVSTGSATSVKSSSGIVYMVSNPAATAVNLLDGTTVIMQIPADTVLTPSVPIYFGTSINAKSTGAAKNIYIQYE